MNTKKILSLIVAVAMIMTVVPMFGLVAGAASTTSVITALDKTVAWSAPDGVSGNVADVWEGWTSTVQNTTVVAVDGSTLKVSHTNRSSSDDMISTITSPGYAAGEDKVIVEWEWDSADTSDLYMTIALKDINDVQIASFNVDRNNDTYPLGKPTANGTKVAVVAYNNEDGTHNVDYYVNGAVNSSEKNLEGTIDGFKTIETSWGPWTIANYAIGFKNLTIGKTKAATDVTVTATYVIGDQVIDTVSQVYDSAAAEGTTFAEKTYYVDGGNYIYHSDATTLTASDVITMEPYANNGPYAQGDKVASGDKLYNIVSGNLIPNGDFSHGLTGWYNGTGAASTATVNTDGSGTITLSGSDAGTNQAGALYRSWEIGEGKTYLYTYTAGNANEYHKTALTNTLGASSNNETGTLGTTLIGGGGSIATKDAAGTNTFVITNTSNYKYLRIQFRWSGGEKVGNFGLYEVEENTEVQKVAGSVELTVGGTTVKTLDMGEVYPNESVTVPAGIYDNAYYVLKDTSVGVDATGKGTLEVKALGSVWTWRAGKVYDGVLDDGGVYVGESNFAAFNWGAAGTVDRVGIAVLDCTNAAANKYVLNATNARSYGDYTATLYVVSKEAYDAVDLSDATALTTLFTDSAKAAEVTPSTYQNEIVLDSAAVQAAVGASGKVVVLGTSIGGLYGLAGEGMSIDAKTVSKVTVNYVKAGTEELLKSVEKETEGDSYTFPASEVFTLDGGYYTLDETTVTTAEGTKTVTVSNTPNKYGVTFDGFFTPEGTDEYEVYAVTDNENSIYLSGKSDDYLSVDIAKDADNVSTIGTSGDSAKTRIGIVEFNKPADYADGKIVTLNLYAYAMHKQLHDARLAVIPTNYDTSTTPANGGRVAKTLITANGNAAFSDAMSSKHVPGDNGDFFEDDAAWITVDVTEIVKNAQGDKVTMLLVLPSGLIKFANAEKAVEGGLYENKAAYLSLSDGATTTVTGASYVTKDGAKVDGETVTVAEGDTVRAYVDGAKVYMVDANGAYLTEATAAGTYTVAGKPGELTAALGYKEDNTLTVNFATGGAMEGATLTITADDTAATVVHTQTLAAADDVFAISPKNSNVTYTATVTDGAGNVLSTTTGALYKLVVEDIAQNEAAYTAEGALVNKERAANASKVIARGGAYVDDTGALDTTVAKIFTLTKDETTGVTTIKITNSALFDMGFGFMTTAENGKVYIGAGSSADGEAGKLYDTITIDAASVTLSSSKDAAGQDVEVFSLEAVEFAFVDEAIVEEEVESDITPDLDFTLVM